MPPQFSKEHFKFPDGVPVPVHIDRPIPIPGADIMPDAYRIEETDGLDSSISIVAADIESFEQAEIIRSARIAFVGGGVGAVINRGTPFYTFRDTVHIPVNSHEFPELRPTEP